MSLGLFEALTYSENTTLFRAITLKNLKESCPCDILDAVDKGSGVSGFAPREKFLWESGVTRKPGQKIGEFLQEPTRCQK